MSRSHNGTTLLVAGVIVHDTAHNRVLLLQRGPDAEFGRGLWDLPVGKSEPGEPITATAVRELREETGLEIDPDTLRVVQIIHGARGHQAPNGFLTVVFAAHEWKGEPENREPHKHARIGWTDTTDLPEAFVPTTRTALRQYLTDGPQVSLGSGWG